MYTIILIFFLFLYLSLFRTARSEFIAVGASLGFDSFLKLLRVLLESVVDHIVVLLIHSQTVLFFLALEEIIF